jgi:hypothetical protein
MEKLRYFALGNGFLTGTPYWLYYLGGVSAGSVAAGEQGSGRGAAAPTPPPGVSAGAVSALG